MTINEVAGLLGYSKEKAECFIADGLALPKSGTIVKLTATRQGGQSDISDEQFDDFVTRFEAEEPGRWPPAGVRRVLLVESGHRCAICKNGPPFQFHHMLDWAKLKHHDPRHMLALCGTCHSRCSNGFVDYKSQAEYKARLQPGAENRQPHFPSAKYRMIADTEQRPWLTIGAQVALRELQQEFGCEVKTDVKVTAGEGWMLLDAAVVRGEEDLVGIEIFDYNGGGFPHFQVENLAKVGSEMKFDRFQKFVLYVVVVSAVDPQLDEAIRIKLEQMRATAPCEVNIRMYRENPLRAKYSL